MKKMPQICGLCLCYFLTFTLLSITLFTAVNIYMGKLRKIDSLENDVKELVIVLTEKNRNTGDCKKSDARIEGGCNVCRQQQQQQQQKQVQPPEDVVESLIQKHTTSLRNEIIETKRMVEQIRCKTGVQKPENTDVMRTDYALESLGGKIVHVEDEPYNGRSFFLSLFGLDPLSNHPRNIINPSMQPGNCYAFKGCRSVVVIKLMAKVFIDSIGIEHIPTSVSPDGVITSAPKDFSVFGMKSATDERPFYFGSFVYNANLGQSVQIFNINKLPSESYNYVKLEFISNNGHPNYTCVYRVTVHGKLDKKGKRSDTC